MKIALLIDVDNYKVNEKEFKYLIDRLNMRGEVVYAKVYNYSDKKNADLTALIEANGYDTAMQTVYNKKTKKSVLDMRIVIDAVRLCYTNSSIDAYCLACGNGDLVSLISTLRAEGKVVLGCFNPGNERNEHVCNEVVMINRVNMEQVRTLVKKTTQKTAVKTQPQPKKVVEPAKRAPIEKPEDIVIPESPDRWERVERQLDEVENNRPAWLDEEITYEAPEPVKQTAPRKTTYEVERVKTTTTRPVEVSKPVEDVKEIEEEEEQPMPQHRFNAQNLAAQLESFARRTAALNFDSGEDIEEKRQLLAEIDECLNHEEFQGEKLTEDEEEAFNEIKSLVQSLKETIQNSIDD